MDERKSPLLGNEFRARSVLTDLTLLVGPTAGENKPGYNNPLGNFLREAVLWPGCLDRLVQRIASGEHSEYRLNGAGLKLYYNDGYLLIAGDQKDAYPGFVREANALLRSKGVCIR